MIYRRIVCSESGNSHLIHYRRLSETDEIRRIIAETYSKMRTVSFRLRYRE